MDDLLFNPVFNALISGDLHLGTGSSTARYYHPEVSPFAGFRGAAKEGFAELHQLLPADARMLIASPEHWEDPSGWKTKVKIEGLQFVFPHLTAATPDKIPVALSTEHVDEMIALTALTKPGPFSRRTIEFGHYYGFFEQGRLVAMAGYRMHVGNYTEISAVCTHPDFLGKGYARALLLHQLNSILAENNKPFLHVRNDNERAIAIYEQVGFVQNRPMNFYFMSKV